MYNLEVAHDHTFTVGEGQWIVHNECGPYDNKIVRDYLTDPSVDNGKKHYEGEAGLFLRYAGFDVADYRKIVNGPTGTEGDIDVSIPGLIVEVKGGKTWRSEYNGQIADAQTNRLINPDGDPVAIYAPNMDDRRFAMAQATGAVFVARTPMELMEYAMIYAKQ